MSGSGSVFQFLVIDNTNNMTEYTVITIAIVHFIRFQIVPLKPKAVFMKMGIDESEYIVLPDIHPLQRYHYIICDRTARVGKGIHGINSNIWRFKNDDIEDWVPSAMIYVDDESLLHDVIGP